MFDLYAVLLTLHILAVIAWVGSGVLAFLIARRVEDPSFPTWVNSIGPIFPVTSFAAALAGIGLWIDGPWGFGEPWILIAVAGWLVSGFLGGARIEPAVRRWAEGDQTGRADYLKIARVDLSIMVVIVADMVMKPGL